LKVVLAIKRLCPVARLVFCGSKGVVMPLPDRGRVRLYPTLPQFLIGAVMWRGDLDFGEFVRSFFVAMGPA
jgi:hypothetical protein